MSVHFLREPSAFLTPAQFESSISVLFWIASLCSASFFFFSVCLSWMLRSKPVIQIFILMTRNGLMIIIFLLLLLLIVTLIKSWPSPHAVISLLLQCGHASLSLVAWTVNSLGNKFSKVLAFIQVFSFRSVFVLMKGSFRDFNYTFPFAMSCLLPSIWNERKLLVNKERPEDEWGRWQTEEGSSEENFIYDLGIFFFLKLWSYVEDLKMSS